MNNIVRHISVILVLLIYSSICLKAQEQTEVQVFSDTSNTEYVGYISMGTGYNLITLKDDFISPNVYSGSGFSLSLALSLGTKTAQWAAEGDIRTGWLAPELNQNLTVADTSQFEQILKNKLNYLRANFLINTRKQLKHSPHSLGGGMGITFIRTKFFRPDKTTSLYPFIEDARFRNLALVGNVSYTYKREIFERPFHLNIHLPLVNLQRFQKKIWTFGSFNSYLQPSIDIGFMLNKPDKYSINYQLFYNWQLTNANENRGIGYQHLSAINTIGLLIKIGDYY